MSSVRTPKQQRGIETRKQIIKAAFRLFAEKGIHGTNSTEIAQKAGISIGSFYSYFRDKKDLFMEIFREHIEEKVVRILSEHRVDPNDRRKSVSRLIRAMLRSLCIMNR